MQCHLRICENTNFMVAAHTSIPVTLIIKPPAMTLYDLRKALASHYLTVRCAHPYGSLVNLIQDLPDRPTACEQLP